MNINSTIFENNVGLNGGAIYFNQSTKKNIDGSFNIVNTTFINNEAFYYGGAIYSDYEGLNLSKIQKVNFRENHAYAGGALYTNKNSEYTLFNVYTNEIQYQNNTSESHGINFATAPYTIIESGQILSDDILKMTSGEGYSFQFYVIDEYDQKVRDISKFYSNIILKITNENQDNERIKFINNECYFSEGKLEFNIINYIILMYIYILM